MNASTKRPTRAILVHGMGRTPVAMLVLAARLRAAGLRPDLFAYSAALEGWRVASGGSVRSSSAVLRGLTLCLSAIRSAPS